MANERWDPTPYPLPRNWQERGLPPLSMTAVALMVVVAAGLLAIGVLRALVGDALATAFWAVCFGALMAGISVARDGAPRRIAPPVMMNAVALTRAQQAPPDSWVHFFREGLGTWWLGVPLALGGIGSGAMLTIAGVRTVADGRGGWLALIAPLGAAALAMLGLGVIALVIRYRAASFGRIPIGLSIGRSGIARYYLDAIETVGWDDIVSVEAMEREERQTEGARRVRIARRGEEPWTLGVDEYSTPPGVIYAALRYWHEHPAAREELGTTFGQRRIERWCHAAQTVDPRRPAAPGVADLPPAGPTPHPPQG